jgi:hypothetical protein
MFQPGQRIEVSFKAFTSVLSEAPRQGTFVRMNATTLVFMCEYGSGGTVHTVKQRSVQRTMIADIKAL